MEWYSAKDLKLSDHPLEKPEILFEKIEDDEIEEMEKRFEKTEESFYLDLRVAKILDVVNHPNADKLYILKIDCGEKRQIIAGIKKWYSPEELKGKKIIIVANLEPAVLRDEKSEGMLLAAESENDVGILFAKDSEPGENVLPSGMTPNPKKKVTFKDFKKIHMKTGKNCVLYKNKKLVTESGEVIKAEKIKEGAEIR